MERRGGRGTAWGWIRIIAPPRQCIDGYMTPEDTAELSQLLDEEVWSNGASIAASDDMLDQLVDTVRRHAPTTTLAISYEVLDIAAVAERLARMDGEEEP